MDEQQITPHLDKIDEAIKKAEEPGDIVVGLDIGTTKICCVIGEVFKDSVEIIGTGIAPSLGIKKGIIVNIESTVKSIKEAVRIAEEMCGVEVDYVNVGIAGNHIKGFNSPGIVAINDREIKSSDIRNVREAAKTVKISPNQEIIHVLPQEYMVDDHTGIQNPLGMTGVRLVTNVHIVTADRSFVKNLATSCHKAGLRVEKLILESIASAESVLDLEEIELGTVLLDIGGGTTDIAVFREGTIRHTCEIGLGGHNITNDLSMGLRTPLHEAERLKEDYGSAISSVIKPNLVVDVPSVGDRPPRKITQKILVDIIQARITEILELVNKELVASGQKNHIKGGIVLTGGTALLENIVELAEQIFDLPVRVGYPTGVEGALDAINTPRCTTAVGLVLYGIKEEMQQMQPEPTLFGKIKGLLKKIT